MFLPVYFCVFYSANKQKINAHAFQITNDCVAVYSLVARQEIWWINMHLNYTARQHKGVPYGSGCH